ncbi:MAG: hypothetical protein ABI847_00930, partial [Anaerolineales bacterium]
MAELRLRNLIALTEQIQVALGLLEPAAEPGEAAVRAVARAAAQTAREVEAMAVQAGTPLAKLAGPSQRAYQWLA